MSVPGGWEFQEDGSQAAEDCFITVCRSFSIYHQGIYLPWRKIENLLKTVINNLQLPDHVGCIWVFRAGGGDECSRGMSVLGDGCLGGWEFHNSLSLQM